jgi:1,4-dihydroxy-2-naphthoate octaprenyltransferase
MIKSWILACRPKTLTAAIVPIAVATALAPKPDWSIFFFSIATALLIQIGTNLANDALDFQKGADTSERLGPIRVTQSGLIPALKVMQGALFAFTLALLFAIPLMLKGGWPIAMIVALSILAGYFYTGGPKPLAYLGLGECFVLIFFGWVSVMAVYYLQTHELGWAPFVAGTQIGLLSCSLIAINNLRDVVGDKKACKKTLAVRFGVPFGKVCIAAALLTPYLLLYYWNAFLPLLAFPLASYLVLNIQKEPPSIRYNPFLAQASLHQLIFGALFIISL